MPKESKPAPAISAVPTHVRFITLSQSGGSMEQFVTTFNDFCRRDDVDVQEVRLHEEYDEPFDMFDENEEDAPESGKSEETSRPYIDIIHDVVAEIWYRPSTGGSSIHAHIFVSEDFRDELEFYEAINDFTAKMDMVETVRAGSPYNRSLVAIFRGKPPEPSEDRLDFLKEKS
jgi:hypothetical protein